VRTPLPARPELDALAERLGVLPGYQAADGSRREIAAATRARLCAALGHPAGSEAEAARSLEACREAERARGLPREALAFVGERAPLRVPGAATSRYTLEITEEQGRRGVRSGRARATRGGLVIPLPRLRVGEHHLTLELEDGGRVLEQTRFVAPRACPTPNAKLGRRRAFGIWANLYATRGAGGLGFGNLADLAGLVRITAAAGGDFVGLNPLHALRNRGAEVSPYAPVTRLFKNPLYLDPEAVPELAGSARARRLLASPGVRQELAALRAARWLDPERSARLLGRLLEPLHAAFRAHASPARRRAFAAYQADAGEALDAFATFRVLEDVLAARGAPRDWRRWPRAYRDPRSSVVRAFRRRHARAIEREAFVQFELDRQLGRAAREAERRGLAVGLYTDLAIGSAPSGFDAWAFGEHFVPDVEVGAPPDDYSRAGQGWGFAPLHPGRLGDGGLGFYARLLRANLRHAGALRIDHILGCFRQWWVPKGARPAAGGYVRFPARALLGIVALQARRAGALVIGEDLGTVPPEVPATLARHGVLSSRVLLFERTRRGGFRSPRRYSKRALVTANTHDLPTLAGWFEGRDLEIRHALGQLTDAAYRRARRERAGDCARLLARLRRDGFLSRSIGTPSAGERLAAVNRFLCSTPAPLVGIALDDLAFEREPVNVPGVGPDAHPSWRRRLRPTLDALARSEDTQRALDGCAARARR
jgi:4-alpha-glucanotransferase